VQELLEQLRIGELGEQIELLVLAQLSD